MFPAPARAPDPDFDLDADPDATAAFSPVEPGPAAAAEPGDASEDPTHIKDDDEGA